MKYTTKQIVFQEVPNEVSLSFLISGCQLKCKGCHSSHSWNIDNGIELDIVKEIEPYKELITCVLFFGGEWIEKELIYNLMICKSSGYKTCLYTGKEKINKEILDYLDYIKYGPYKEELGGLNSLITNQRFIRLIDNKDLTNLFK